MNEEMINKIGGCMVAKARMINRGIEMVMAFEEGGVRLASYHWGEFVAMKQLLNAMDVGFTYEHEESGKITEINIDGKRFEAGCVSMDFPKKRTL